MLISIRIDSILKARIDELVKSGHYPDFNAAAVVALENLWTVEQEYAGQRIVSDRPVSLEPKSEVVAAVAATSDRMIEGASIGSPQSVLKWSAGHTLAKDLNQPLPVDRFTKKEAVPVERWVFGQQNRLLPLKVNARLLVIYAEERADTMALAKMAERISAGVGEVYSFLAELDHRLGHKKDEMLATAFPMPDSDKSRQRYAVHFVAAESTTGELSGLLLEWKLATVVRKKSKAYLYPTQAGLDFANLTNPLLDGDLPAKPVKFSCEEIDWALRHVAEHVPVEAYAFVTLLKGIEAGADDPTKLDAYLREAGVVGEKGTSPEFVATQRSGALSRMADLELIRRIRNGVRVTYAASERGVAWRQQL